MEYGKDWQGRDVAKEEADDDAFLAWEITPHVQTKEFDSCIIRGWQEMLELVKDNIDLFLERYDEDELREGVTLRFRLVHSSKREMGELSFAGEG